MSTKVSVGAWPFFSDVERNSPHYIHCRSKGTGFFDCCAGRCTIGCRVPDWCLYFATKKKNLKIQHNNGILRKDWLLYFLVFQFARPLPLSVTAPCSKQHIPFLREIYFFYFPPQKKPAFRFIVFDFCLSTPFIS